MKARIRQHKTENYLHPILEIKTSQAKQKDEVIKKLQQFLLDHKSHFHSTDSGTVFVHITIQNNNLFEHYLNITTEFSDYCKFKTWGFQYDNHSDIFISCTEESICWETLRSVI